MIFLVENDVVEHEEIEIKMVEEKITLNNDMYRFIVYDDVNENLEIIEHESYINNKTVVLENKEPVKSIKYPKIKNNDQKIESDVSKRLVNIINSVLDGSNNILSNFNTIPVGISKSSQEIIDKTKYRKN